MFISRYNLENLGIDGTSPEKIVMGGGRRGSDVTRNDQKGGHYQGEGVILPPPLQLGSMYHWKALCKEPGNN